MKYIIPLLIIFMAVLETAGQSCIRYAHLFKRPIIGIAAPFIYTIICYILYKLYSMENMAVVNGWWNVATSIGVFVTSTVVFADTIHKTDYLGISMVLVGALFLNLGGKLKLHM